MITLFEDIGLTNTDLAWRLFATRDVCRRQPHLKTWPVISTLVEIMCGAEKTQAANHIIHLCLHDQKLIEVMVSLSEQPYEQACTWTLTEDRPPTDIVAALWMLSGFSLLGITPPIQHPEADPKRIYDTLGQIIPDPETHEIMMMGIRTGANILAISSAITAIEARTEGLQHKSTQDHMPTEMRVCELPCWAFDQYTRAGKAALRRAITECSNIKAALRHINKGQHNHLRALSSTHFEYESGLLAKRIQTPGHLNLLNQVRTIGPFRDAETALKIYEAMDADWESFQDIRADEIQKHLA